MLQIYPPRLAMDTKKMGQFLSFLFSKQFLKHAAIALALVFAIAISSFVVLHFYTHHGESVQVPNLKGLKLEKAIELLEASDLAYEVIDSVYLPQLKAGTIVEQTPLGKEKVKQYRQVYLVINSYAKPFVSLPDVRDLSSRNAKATLEALGLKVAGMQYVPSEYKDLVKDVKFGGRILLPGARIQRESSVILLVGGDVSDSEITMPSLRGLKLEAVNASLRKDSLSLGSVQFDVVPRNKVDSAQFFVYKQEPITGSSVNLGRAINIWLTKNKALLEEPEAIFENTDSVTRPRNSRDIEDFNF